MAEVSNLVTAWRLAVQADLQAAFPDADVGGGERTGVSRDLDRVRVAWPGFQEMAGEVVVGDPRLVIRYWPRRPKVRGDESTPDPTALEVAGMALLEFGQAAQTAYDQAGLAAKLAELGHTYTGPGLWFSRMVSCRPDHDPDEWAVEAVLIGRCANPAVLDLS